MQISTDENVFKSLYFKNICPGYEQFFEPEKLFLRVTDDPAEIMRRQNILRDLLDHPELYEDLCFISEAVMQFKASFDDMPNRNLGDFRLNLERFNDVNGAVGLLVRFLKAAEYTAQYPWMKSFSEGIKKLSETRSIDKMVTAWGEMFVSEEFMHACDFGFNLDDVLWPTHYKLLAMREQEYNKKNTSYKIEPIKMPLLDRIQGTMRNTTVLERTGATLSGGGAHHLYNMGDELTKGDDLIFDEGTALGRSKIESATNAVITDPLKFFNTNDLSENYLLKSYACQFLEGVAVADAPTRIKYFITSLLGDLEPLVTEFVPYLCAAKIALYWREKGVPYCIPELGMSGEVVIQGLIDPYISQNEGVEVTIENNVMLNGEIAVVTGANRGGKTAFVTSVTLCQILFQLGFPIPAKWAKLGVFNCMATVFAGEEQGLIGTGRLGEELKKLAAALTTAQAENTFICLNEPLTGTSSRDGEHILAEALCMLKQVGATGFVVTHLLGLAKAFDKMNELGGSSLITLTAQTDGDKPLYKIIPAPAAETSHAKAVVKRFIS